MVRCAPPVHSGRVGAGVVDEPVAAGQGCGARHRHVHVVDPAGAPGWQPAGVPGGPRSTSRGDPGGEGRRDENSLGSDGMILRPKPPPVSGAITSTLGLGEAEPGASPFLMVRGAWVESQTRRTASPRVVLGHHPAAAPDGASAAPLDDEPLAQDARRAAEGSIGIADGLREPGDAIVGNVVVDERGMRGEGRFGIDHGRRAARTLRRRLSATQRLPPRRRSAPPRAAALGARVGEDEDAGSGGGPAGCRSPSSRAASARCTPGRRRAGAAGRGKVGPARAGCAGPPRGGGRPGPCRARSTRGRAKAGILAGATRAPIMGLDDVGMSSSAGPDGTTRARPMGPHGAVERARGAKQRACVASRRTTRRRSTSRQRPVPDHC